MHPTTAFAFVPALGVLALAAASAPLAQPQAVHRETLQSRDVPAPTYRSELMRVHVDRGGLVARHTHPGLEIGYIEDGQATVKIAGAPDRSLAKGDSFSVLAGTPHSVQNTGPGELTILSTYVVDKSKPLATPVP
jgi:quercetin dioxygenase-like cupin family protein